MGADRQGKQNCQKSNGQEVAEEGQPGCPPGSPQNGVRGVRQQLARVQPDYVIYASWHNIIDIQFFCLQAKGNNLVKHKGVEPRKVLLSMGGPSTAVTLVLHSFFEGCPSLPRSDSQ